MLTEEQIKKIISANESLQVQLDDANNMLEARNQEISVLVEELNDTTALRSRLEGQLDEIESFQNRLGEKQKAVQGAEAREFELHGELTEMAALKKEYDELLQDYAYLQSQYKDVRAQLEALVERNFDLEKSAGKIGELESRLEIGIIERDELKNRIATLETQRFLGEFKL